MSDELVDIGIGALQMGFAVGLLTLVISGMLLGFVVYLKALIG